MIINILKTISVYTYFVLLVSMKSVSFKYFNLLKNFFPYSNFNISELIILNSSALTPSNLR
jgi:hypothetical protein